MTGRRPVDRAAVREGFYVSPFMDMDMTYAFRVALPGERVAVAIRTGDKDGLMLHRRPDWRRGALTDAALLRVLVTHPLLTLKVIGAIHWHALRMLLKGIPAAFAAHSASYTSDYRRRQGSAAMTLSSSSFPLAIPVQERARVRAYSARLLDQALPALQAGRLQIVLPNGDAIDRSGDHPGRRPVSLRRWRGLWRMLDGRGKRLQQWLSRRRLVDAGAEPTAGIGHAQ